MKVHLHLQNVYNKHSTCGCLTFVAVSGYHYLANVNTVAHCSHCSGALLEAKHGKAHYVTFFLPENSARVIYIEVSPQAVRGNRKGWGKFLSYVTTCSHIGNKKKRLILVKSYTQNLKESGFTYFSFGSGFAKCKHKCVLVF